MKAKIDLEKLISSMLGYAEDNCEETMLDYLHSALQDQGLEYKDGEIVEIEQEDIRKRYERIGKSDWFKKTHEGMSVTIPGNLKGTDTDGGVVGEKGEEGEQPSEEELVGMGELGKIWEEKAEKLKQSIEDNRMGCVIQRLDKIISLLESSILIIPNEESRKSPFAPPYTVTCASTFGSDFDIDTNKIKQDETSKPES